MAGPVLSDAASVLSRHDRSSRYEKGTPPSPGYYPHPPHPHAHAHANAYTHAHAHAHHALLGRRPRSPDSLHLPSTHSLSGSAYVSQPVQACHEMGVDRPTLPGIASILAFAGHDPARPQSSSSSRSRPTRPQSSDPIAHALPAHAPALAPPPTNSIPFHSSHHPEPALASSSSPSGNDASRRRRSSNTTNLNSDCVLPSAHNTIPRRPTYPHIPRPPTTSSLGYPHLPSGSSPSAAPATHAIHELPYSRPDKRQSREDRLSVHGLEPSSSLGPSPNKHRAGLSVANDPIQRRHSERISGRRPRLAATRVTQHDRGALSQSGCYLAGGTREPVARAGLGVDTRLPQHSYATTPIAGLGGPSEAAVRHIRRLSNASASSSSSVSVSCSASLSSDFGASLSIGSQAHLNLASTQPTSLSVSANSTTSGLLEQRMRQRQHVERAGSVEEEGTPLGGTWQTREEERAWESQERASAIRMAAPPPGPEPTSASPELGPRDAVLAAMGNQQHRYQCLEPGCGKTFSRPSSLKIHSYSHTGQKPFKCLRCDRAFSVQSNLKRHQKVHERRSGGMTRGAMTSGSGGTTASGSNGIMGAERGSSSGGGSGGTCRRTLIEEESGEDDAFGSEQGNEDHSMMLMMEE